LQKRLIILPIAWGAFGLGEVLALKFLFGSILDIVPTVPNDKPIGGSVLPVLFFNSAVILGIIASTLYAVGFWKADLSSRKTRIELAALAVFLGSGFLLWYTAAALVTGVVALLFLLAVNVE